MTAGKVTLTDAHQRVVAVLAADPAVGPKLLKEIDRFVRSMVARQVTDLADITDSLVADYLGQVTFWHGRARDPSPSTVNTRRWAVRAFFQEARRQGLTDKAIAVDLPIPARSGPPARPLTDDEVWACEQLARHTLDETRAPAVLALAEAGGDAGEIAAVRIDDINLAKGTVAFRGGTRQRGRTNHLTEWGEEWVARHLRRIGDCPPDAPLVVSPGVDGESATSSISGELGNILRHAGLAGDPAVLPHSIRAWSAVKVWERTHDFAAVANWLGSRSLDQAAAVIEVDWRLP